MEVVLSNNVILKFRNFISLNARRYMHLLAGPGALQHFRNGFLYMYNTEY